MHLFCVVTCTYVCMSGRSPVNSRWLINTMCVCTGPCCMLLTGCPSGAVVHDCYRHPLHFL